MINRACCTCEKLILSFEFAFLGSILELFRFLPQLAEKNNEKRFGKQSLLNFLASFSTISQ